MRILSILLVLCVTAFGAQLSSGKSPRVLEIEQKFNLKFDKLAAGDGEMWWVFFKTPITPVVVHVDAPDEEVSAAIETSYTAVRLFIALSKEEADRKEKKK